MRVLTTGAQVGKAVKNIARLRQILGVFGKHGFRTFVTRMGLEKEGGSEKEAEGIEHLTIPERLRMAFETLGPTFVKLGQLLANRPDMIPDDFVEELKKLQDDVKQLEFSVIKTQVEKELGGALENYFNFFSEVPLASASIGQVHEAVLKNGDAVVVKVQRPGIAEAIKSDVAILSFLAKMMEKYIPESQVIGPVTIVDEFFRTLNYELDFVIEANTMMRVSDNFKTNTRIIIPKVYRHLTTQKVLTMERLNGVRITDISRLHELGIDPKELAVVGVKAFFQMVLLDGLFHGDLHGGNLFAMKDFETGESKVGVIDFGIVGRLSEKSRDAFTRMVFALLTEDYESLCYEYADIAAYGAGIDFEKFQSEVRNVLSPYMGLPLKDMHVGRVLIDATRIAVRYNIKIPSDWMIVFKAIFTLEGLGKQLDPDFDVLTLSEELVRTAIKNRYSVQRIGKDAAWVLRDMNALLQSAPRQIRWMFRKFNSNDFAIEVKWKEAEILRRQLERGYRGVGMSIICAGLFIASAMSLHVQTGPTILGYPAASMFFMFCAMIGMMSLIFKNWR